MALSDLLPWNWGSGGYSNPANASNYSDPSLDTFTPSNVGLNPNAGSDTGNLSLGSNAIGSGASFTGDAPSSGGMNWAGLSSGLSALSKNLTGSGQQSGSNTLQTSPSVSSTVSGGTLQPQGAGGGASALASMLNNREQLGQYVLLSALQGKGRGKSGQGLLG